MAVDENVNIIFGRAICKDCLCCMLYKVKDSGKKLKFFGTKNMVDHSESCQFRSGKQTSITSFVKRRPGIKLSNTERMSIKEAEVCMVVHCGTSFIILDNECTGCYYFKWL